LRQFFNNIFLGVSQENDSKFIFGWFLSRPEPRSKLGLECTMTSPEMV
jgi:hypothetical protein